MAGRWVNTEPDESSNASSDKAKDIAMTIASIATNAGIAIIAYLVGVKFSSLLIGLLSYFLIEIAHVACLLLLIDKDALQKLISLNDLNKNDEMKVIVNEQLHKHSLESVCIVAAIYLGLHMWLGI